VSSKHEQIPLYSADGTSLGLRTPEAERRLIAGGYVKPSYGSKTLRSIAGVVSSAHSRAMKWGLVKVNPVSSSEPPVLRRRRGIALTPAEQALLFETASGPWCISVFLQLAGATGARRGELLALRWSDIVDGRAVISRSLTQTNAVSISKPRRPRTAFA
jgi:integrase